MECVFSWFNIFLIYQTSITMLILWYFIANIDKYLGYITDQSTCEHVNFVIYILSGNKLILHEF